MVRLKVTPVVGLPQFTGWSQVAESSLSVGARLVSVFAVFGKHAGNVGRDVADRIADFYFYDIEQLHKFIISLISFVEENDCQLFISCALVTNNKSIFFTKGGAVFLKRGEKIGKILFSDDEVKVLSGKHEQDDIFVLTTLQASEFLSEIEQKFSQGFDTDIIITSIVPGLHAQEDSSLSAIVFINSLSHKDEEKEDKHAMVTVETEKIEDEVSAMSLSISHTEQHSVDKKDVVKEEDKVDENNFVNKVKKVIQKIMIGLIAVRRKGLAVLLSLLKWFVKLIKSIYFLVVSFILMLFRKNGTKKMSIIFGIVTILVIFAIFSVVNRVKETKRITALLLPIQTQVLEAKDSLDTDILASRDQVNSALVKLKQLKQENERSVKVNLIDNELELTTQFYDEISGKEEFSLLDTFYDLRLIQSDYLANQMTIVDHYLVTLDSEKKAVVLLDINSKKVKVVDLGQFSSARGLSGNENDIFILVDGIQKLSLKDQEVWEVRNLGDSNRHATLISAYDRFVYVVNPEKHNIYRYSKEEDGYSDPIGWMKSSGGLEYASVTSFMVDGDIWLSTNKGELLKFSSGKLQDFTVLGLDSEFGDSIKVFTNKEQKNLYVLDADNNRVVVLDKTGRFVKEIKSISIKTVTDLVVNEALGKLFLASGSIIYQVDL